MGPEQPDRSTGWRRLIRRPFPVLFGSLGVVVLVGCLVDPRPLDVVAVALLALAGLAANLERQDLAALQGGRRTEAESFARILRGLARSVSPDAIVAAIVEELGAATGADHVAVVRRQPDAETLEATLMASRPGSVASRTMLPPGDLDDPALDELVFAGPTTASPSRRLAAIPIAPDPERDPRLAPLGSGREGEGIEPGPMPWGRGPVTATVVRHASGTLPTTALRIPLREGTNGVRATVRSGGGRPRRAALPPLPEEAGQRIADRIAARLRDVYGVSHTIAAPLRIDGRVEGAIVLSRRTASPWPVPTRRILAAAAIEASAALDRVYSLRAAEARATTDALTGLPNRRYFDEYVVALARRRRAEDRIGVLMIDIDRFKRLNDTHGHAVGDHVLRDVARAIAGAVREDDVPARIGGEEFAVLLRNPSREVAVEVGERVRHAVGSLDLRSLGVPGVSVSVGVAVATRPDERLDDVIGDADEALYRAKRAGRDRVVA